MVENYKRFLKIIQEFKFYIVEFNKNNIIKNKKYLIDFAICKKIK